MMMRDRSRIATRALAFAGILGLLPTAAPGQESGSVSPSPAQIQFFESQVRPVLVESCQGCHGQAKVKAGLRLDSRAAMVAGGDSGPAVAVGKADESLLVERVKSGDMPPKGKLSARQIEALSQWVGMGAPWPGGEAVAAEAAAEPTSSNIRKPGYAVTDADRLHWSFRPLTRPEPPPVPAGYPGLRPIDRFIAAGLGAKGLTPNPPATRLELLRRVTYDLTGLPPTPAEVDAFEADAAPDAYERLVDRLLDSPRYGEKWGRHWLDLVRFAETNSYERDGAKPNAWRYRDYVIRSMNDDKPYDRFIREQLAGDELPDGGHDGLIATGYYRLGLWDDEPADREQARFDGLDDIVATTSQVFLGLTVDCARCHDHKLDPIPQKDYYRFLSFFQNVNDYRNEGPTVEALLFRDDDQRRAYADSRADLDRRRDLAQAEISAIETEFRTLHAARDGRKVGVVDIDDLTYRFYRDTWKALPDFDALKSEDAGKLPAGQISLAPRTRDSAFGFVFEGTLIVPEAGDYAFHLDSDDGSRLMIDGAEVARRDGIHGEGRPQVAPVRLNQGRVPIRLDYFQAGHGLGLSLAWSGPGFALRTLSAPTQPIGSAAEPAREPEAKGTPQDLNALFRKDGREVLGMVKIQRYRALKRDLDTLKKEKPAADRALVVTESGPQPRPTHVMLRGNPHSPGDAVEPAFLQVASTIAPAAPAPGTRTTGRRTVLADWIASPSNPLTARVMANRVWQYHFGRGIARSSSNLGTQGDKPTHPELIDWLASELIAGGWKLKALHRTILLSDAYRRSSRGQAEALASDPQNDLFWRFEMRRLTAEEIRDSILRVTGSLNLKMYGPGVYPEIPAEVLAGQSVPGAGWHTSPLEDQARRSVYVHVKRSLLVPILESYDMAETDRSSPIRFATTQPTQALGMINGSFINRHAFALASRLKAEAGDAPADRVTLALRLITDRRPTQAEIERGVGLIAGLQGRGVSADAALASFCLVALNLDEFIYLD